MATFGDSLSYDGKKWAATTLNRSEVLRSKLEGAEADASIAEYEAIHSNGENVQYDSVGQPINWTPIKTNAYVQDLESFRKNPVYVSNYAPEHLGKLACRQFIDDAQAIDEMRAVGDGLEEAESASPEYVPATAAQSMGKALNDYLQTNARYDAALANPNLSEERKAQLQEAKNSYQLSAMRGIQEAHNQISVDDGLSAKTLTGGVSAPSTEFKEREAQSSTDAYQLNELADTKFARRSARKAQNSYASDVDVSDFAVPQNDLEKE